jgi:two-component system sensor histidine kinase AtoS
MNQAGETNRLHWGPNFDDALRACLKSGVVLIDTNRHVATLTPDARDILGFSYEQGLEVSTSALPAALVNLAVEVLASGKPGIAPPGTIRLKNARQSVSVTAVPTRSTPLDSIAVVTLHTVSASTEFLQRIRQLDRLANAGTLAAGMAHEIKNAMVAGRTFLDLLLEKNQEDELAQVVRRETGRIDVIVSRMLRFAGTNAGEQSSLPVHDLLDQALRLIEPQLDGRSITLQRDFQATTDLIKADEYELHQAFVNLLLNALEAMPQEGTLSVRTMEPELSSGQSFIQVEIADTGSGILPEHMDQVFEPFFTTKAAGTGLGLAVTRRIIEEHGGSISVQSRPDHGTVFVIKLPLFSPPTAA